MWSDLTSPEVALKSTHTSLTHTGQDSIRGAAATGSGSKPQEVLAAAGEGGGVCGGEGEEGGGRVLACRDV